MIKTIILKSVSVVLTILAVVSILCAITGKGSGFLYLSNIAKMVCYGVAAVCVTLAVIAWKISTQKK